MTETCRYLQAIVFDWAGTMVDHGSRAPAIVFQKVFQARGIEISEAQAREPMGMAKRDHIAAIAAMPNVAQSWQSIFGRPCDEDDIDLMYSDFLPLQKKTLGQHCDLIDGAADVADHCRNLGLKIGSSTGYTRELMEVVSEAAQQQGYQPDCVLCAEDAPRGRPAPYLLFEASKRLDVYPMWTIVKVDDTAVGIEAGRSAGCWTVGITRTGNGVGLSVDQVKTLPAEQIEQLCNDAAKKLTDAGAHFIIESVADLPTVIQQIEQRSAQGELPIQVRK